MSDFKLSQLAIMLNADLADSDLFYVADVSEGESKKISVAQLDLRYSAPVLTLADRVTQNESDIGDLQDDVIALDAADVDLDIRVTALEEGGGGGGGATGGGTDEIFYENGQNVTTDYTITAGKNALSAGPITIDDGVTVTVPSGSEWTIV